MYFILESNFHNGYLIKDKCSSSCFNSCFTVVRVDSEKNLTFADCIITKDDKDEIRDFATRAKII